MNDPRFRHEEHGTDDARIDAAIRALPDVPLDDDVRRAILAATSGVEPRPGRARGVVGRIGLALAAAACVSISSVGALLLAPVDREPGQLSDAELEQLDREVQITFAILASAIDRAERIAVAEGLLRGTAPAFDVLSGEAARTP
ncbi:MAG: hypothetical protein ACYTJ0_18980 [Planctomycetota bacterium]|jgi:anti-sigma factor RsiW